ncbi:hypothetical protein PT974_05478 [Cladobotryum mycophilum]|uniref:Uncharacterized protein n=1 Tax=Cladobotryum mycophilum TaxID=491253 RepID=A0ABR0SIU6_9HYPO
MPRFILSLPLLVAILAFLIPSVSASDRQFQHWYPEWGFIFDHFLHTNCSSEYNLFLNGKKNRTEWELTSHWLGAGSSAALVVPVVDCILDHSPEYVKTGMAGANVVLGLAPTILSTLGIGVDETALLSVIGKRPFLALCLSVGSPAVQQLRLFQYSKLTEVLDDRNGRFPSAFFSLHTEVIILVIEYLAVFASIANVASLGYQLGFNTVVTFAPHLTYLFLLWAFLGAIPHMVAAWGLYLRIDSDHGKGDGLIGGRLKRWATPWMMRGPVKFWIVKETPLYILLSFFLSLLTSCHVIFGTLVFSSTLFISVRDSIPIIARLLASVILCRIVLMYELSRLRHLWNTEYHLVDVDFMRKGEGG